VKSSPLARRIAAELGVDIALVLGSGPGGRIVERDVRAHAEKVGARPMPKMETPAPKVETAPAQAPPSAPIAAPPMAPVLAGADIEPSQMRKAIAKRTAQSKQHAPHFYVTMVIEMDRALALLKELNADAMDSKVTVNDLVVKACAVALGRVPEVNATWTPDGKIRRYAEAHIGVAVGVEDGLIIPVIRDCHAKPLRQISADAKGLIHKARNHQLKPEEYSGGTFSISNMGMMGVDEFIAIINPPEAAILAVGTATREPVVGENDAIVIKTRMKVSLSADHRVLDGVTAARFLQEVKKALEAPFSLLS
jgi:pyruvate dehydrogenase E2 component (dihydrolipoamide acetyltransferase)